jgi:hypothetical protein
MRVIRFLLPGLLASVLLAFGVSAAQAAPEFGVETFVAANCIKTHEECVEEVPAPKFGPFTYSYPKEPTKTEAEEGGYTQAAGHPAWGITAFKVNTEGTFPNEAPVGVGEGKVVTHVRTDVAPGVSTSPEAVGKCSFAEFGEEALPKSGLYPAPKCNADSEIGENKVVLYAGPGGVSKAPEISDLPLTGKVYNLVQPAGLASDFGVALPLPMTSTAAKLKASFEKAEKEGAKPGENGFPSLPEQTFLEAQQYYAHTLIEGGVEWAGNYHDYYEISVNPEIPLIASRLILKGNIGSTNQGGFITNPSNCAGPGPLTTNTLTLTAGALQAPPKQYTTPIGTEGCLGEAGFSEVPFAPKFVLEPGKGESVSDQPDGITTEVIVPHAKGAEEIDTSQVKTATIVMPAGMTLNPSAAKGLQACTPAQVGIGTRNEVRCPEASEIGRVTLTVPQLPASEPLTGSVYLGGPSSGPITGPPYTIYVRAFSERYGVDVRLKGTVEPNLTTGQLTTIFTENPEQPFSNLTLKFRGGALAPIANPLSCGMATAATSFVPFTATAAQSPISGFVVDSNGSGGACAPSILALGQSTSESNSTAGAYTSYKDELARGDGQQYLTKVSTTLPAGLLGAIPSLTLCGEAEATAVNCPANSKIGTATVQAGAGKEPYSFSGPVYMTGPYNGAPYGMEIVVSTAAGPFNFGNEVVRATINVNPESTRLTVTATVPTIKAGIPLRIKSMSVAVEREKFLFNPTNCGTLTTDTSLSGTPTLPPLAGATQGISTPFQVNGCGALGFKPTFTASSEGKTTRKIGASLNVNVGYTAGQANIKYVKTTLPKQLPSRLTTLNKACLAATFQANPATCPAASVVGTATVATPVLPDKMTGPAILVSHGGAAFPDLEIVLSGDNVTVILDGTTNITGGITTSTFAAVPDAPVSSFALSLPQGPHSVFAANGNLCTKPLIMPTVIEGQNGGKITQNTLISVTGCGVVISAHKVKRHTATLTVYGPAAGKATASGAHLRRATKKISQAGKAVTLKVSLSKAGVATLNRKGKLKVKIQVGFKPTKKGASSKVSVTVTFRR